MAAILEGTDFDFLGRKYTGKVRDVYEQPDRLILISTDRHSSFDRIIAHIPLKGQVLNQISAFWLQLSAAGMKAEQMSTKPTMLVISSGTVRFILGRVGRAWDDVAGYQGNAARRVGDRRSQLMRWASRSGGV